MKLFVIFILLVLIAIPVALAVLGMMSRSGTSPGLKNAKLAACPASPNCVCSEFADDSEHYVPALDLGADSTAAAMAKLTQIIRDMGGSIENTPLSSTQSTDYIAATFHSSLFGFVDDLELRADAANNVIQVRSAARVGKSDLGVNKKRVELLRQKLLSSR